MINTTYNFSRKKVAGAGFEPRDLKVMGLASTPG